MASKYEMFVMSTAVPECVQGPGLREFAQQVPRELKGQKIRNKEEDIKDERKEEGSAMTASRM
jgi:hypothetical protein